MGKGEQWQKYVNDIPTLTLDTNVVYEHWKQRDKSKTVEKLIELASAIPLSLRVTGRIREDVPRSPLADRIDDLPELGVKLMGSVIRPLHWRPGSDQPGSTEFEIVYASLTDPEYRQKDKDWKDWDHLRAHYINKRDVFLTWDDMILRLSRQLRARLGIVVMMPEEYLKTIEHPISH